MVASNMAGPAKSSSAFKKKNIAALIESQQQLLGDSQATRARALRQAKYQL